MVFAEDGSNTGLRTGDDGLGMGVHWKDRCRDVDVFAFEHFTVIAVAFFEVETFAKQREVVGVGIGSGDHLCLGVEGIGTGVPRSLSTTADDTDAIGCHGKDL